VGGEEVREKRDHYARQVIDGGEGIRNDKKSRTEKKKNKGAERSETDQEEIFQQWGRSKGGGVFLGVSFFKKDGGTLENLPRVTMGKKVQKKNKAGGAPRNRKKQRKKKGE